MAGVIKREKDSDYKEGTNEQDPSASGTWLFLKITDENMADYFISKDLLK